MWLGLIGVLQRIIDFFVGKGGRCRMFCSAFCNWILLRSNHEINLN